MLDPPVDVGEDQVIETIPEVLSPATVVIDGAEAGATKVKEIAELAVPVSTALPATTVTE